jgi:hypothetical protein
MRILLWRDSIRESEKQKVIIIPTFEVSTGMVQQGMVSRPFEKIMQMN